MIDSHVSLEEDINIDSASTLISHAGSLLHIGQFFFDEAWNDKVYAISPYTDDTNDRTLNVDDSILAEENADGNNAYIEFVIHTFYLIPLSHYLHYERLELIGDDVSEGILGYVSKCCISPPLLKSKVLTRICSYGCQLLCIILHHEHKLPQLDWLRLEASIVPCSRL